MKKLLALLVLAVISVAVFALGSFRNGPDGKALLHVADEVALTVKVAQPEQGEIIRLVQAPGDVEAVLEVEISSEVVGKILEMPVEEGDPVKKGDLLCRLDDADYRARVTSAEANVAKLGAVITQAEADLTKAERDYTRQVRLVESDATSATELADYRTALTRARASLEVRRQELVEAKARLQSAKEDLEKTVITAAIDGVISRLSVKQGEVVVTGTMNNPGTVIMSISDLSKMQARARVDEVDVPLVQAGQKGRVYLQSEPDTPVPARVCRVASKGTKATGRDVVTFEALLEILSNDARIKPGMTANVEIEVARSNDAITVPVESVVHRMRKDLPTSVVEAFDLKQADLDVSERVRLAQYIKVVYIMEDDVAKVRLIEPGIADARNLEILKGVDMADRVIIGPYRSLDQLKDGRKVALAKEAEQKQDAPDAEGESQEEKVTQDDKQGEGKTDARDDDKALTASASP